MGICLLTGIYIIMLVCTVSSVEICSNETEHGRQISLYKTYSSGASCGCSVNLVNGNENTTVTFQQILDPQGCQYKLIFNWNTNTTEYACKEYEGITYQFNMTPTDQLYVYLVNDRNNTSGFVFNFTIVTNGPPVELTCRSPWTNPQVITQTSPTTVVGSILQYDSTTTVVGSSLQYDSTPGTPRQIESTETTDRRQITEESQTSDLPVIVGCTVGGLVLVSVTVIIVICFLKRRKQKHQNDVNVSDLKITDRSNYSDCYDNIPTSFIQTENSNTDSLDNDLDKSKQGEPALEQLEHIPEQLERVPSTSAEYAVVQKKPKKRVSQDKGMELNNNPNKTIKHDDYENLPKDNLNLKMEINRIVGPKGDNYTLVNKC